MSYARTDDGFYAKPEVLETDLAALGLFGLARVYCADQQTDGKLTAKTVVMLARSREQADILAAHLVETGLWLRDGDGYVDRTYLTDNPSAREVEKSKKAAKLRMRSFRNRSAERNDSVTRNERRTNAFVPERSGEERSTSLSSPSSKRKRRARAEGVPLPDDFVLTGEMAAKLTAKGCRGPALAFEQFRNHHLAKGTLSASWPHSFATWVGNHGIYGCEGCGPKVRAFTKPSARDNAKAIAAEWAAEEAV